MHESRKNSRRAKGAGPSQDMAVSPVLLYLASWTGPGRSLVTRALAARASRQLRGPRHDCRRRRPFVQRRVRRPRRTRVLALETAAAIIWDVSRGVGDDGRAKKCRDDDEDGHGRRSGRCHALPRR